MLKIKDIKIVIYSDYLAACVCCIINVRFCRAELYTRLSEDRRQSWTIRLEPVLWSLPLRLPELV